MAVGTAATLLAADQVAKTAHDKKKQGMNAGVIWGIVILIIFVIVLIVMLVMYLREKHQGRSFLSR